MRKTLVERVKTIELCAPLLIRSDTELERYTDVLFELTSLPKPTVAQLKTINLLSLLVETYETERFPI